MQGNFITVYQWKIIWVQPSFSGLKTPSSNVGYYSHTPKRKKTIIHINNETLDICDRIYPSWNRSSIHIQSLQSLSGCSFLEMKRQYHFLYDIFLWRHDDSKYKTEVFASALQKCGCVCSLSVAWPPFKKSLTTSWIQMSSYLVLNPSPQRLCITWYFFIWMIPTISQIKC